MRPERGRAAAHGGARGRRGVCGGRSVQRSPGDTAAPRRLGPLRGVQPRGPRPSPDGPGQTRSGSGVRSGRQGATEREFPGALSGKFRGECHGVTDRPEAGARPWCGTRSADPASGRAIARAATACGVGIDSTGRGRAAAHGGARGRRGVCGGRSVRAEPRGHSRPQAAWPLCEAFSLAARGRPRTARAGPVQGQASVQDARKATELELPGACREIPRRGPVSELLPKAKPQPWRATRSSYCAAGREIARGDPRTQGRLRGAERSAEPRGTAAPRRLGPLRGVQPRGPRPSPDGPGQTRPGSGVRSGRKASDRAGISRCPAGKFRGGGQ